SSVDLHVTAKRLFTKMTCRAIKRLDLTRIGQHRSQFMVRKHAKSVAIVAPHHENRETNPGFSQLDTLLDESHAHPVDFRSLEDPRHGFCPMTVSVCFEHSPNGRRSARLLE